MVTLNLLLGWCWLLIGMVAGTVAGLRFHHDDWLGGYASWRRRLMRLGHVSFFGTGALNLALALSIGTVDGDSTGVACTSVLLVLGALTMPLVCYLSAWRRVWRQAFFIPVVSLIAGTATFLVFVIRNHLSGG